MAALLFLQLLHPPAAEAVVLSLVLQQVSLVVLAAVQKATRLALAERLHHLVKVLQVVLVLEAEQQAAAAAQPQ
jgi:hypothetical protein